MEPSSWNDAAIALLEEMTSLHAALLHETPRRLQDGRLFTLADLDSATIARSSRMADEVVKEAVTAVVPARGRVGLLEIGCGTGIHIRSAASLNPDLTALGLDLSPAGMPRIRVACRSA